MFERFDEIFASCGWRTVELRYGKKLGAALAKHPALKAWLDDLPNADFAALSLPGRRGMARADRRRPRQGRRRLPQGA